MEYQEIQNQLRELAEKEYQEFTGKLILNVPPERILGVRLPVMRKMAAKIARGNWKDYVAEEKEYFEEIMLEGMVLGEVSLPWEELEPYLRRFIPKIDNWSVCDSFCTGLKIASREHEKVWQFLRGYLESEQAYEIRFALVMILKYYVEESHREEVFGWFDRICHPDYYVKMAVAWAVSCWYLKFPRETFSYLKNDRMDDFTHNKTIQKIRESRRVSKQEKQELMKLKR